MKKPLLGMAALAFLAACGGGGDDDGGVIVVPGTPTPSPTPAPTPAPTPTPTGYGVTQIGTADYSALAFLPDGRSILTRSDGTVSIGAATTPAAPVALAAKVPTGDISGGGVLDVVVDPAFATNGLVYFTSTEGRIGGTVAMTVVRGRLSGTGTAVTLSDQLVIWRGNAVTLTNTTTNYGGKMAFKDGTLLVAIGDFGLPDAAQDLSGALGKIIRINTDGSPAAGNPQLGIPGRQVDVFSYGHRAPTGLTVGTDGTIYETELAPRVGDELNVVQSGRNYGWPLASEGSREDFSAYPRHSEVQGVTAPYYVWRTVTVPTDLIQVRSQKDGLAGQLLIGTSSGQDVKRFTPGTNAPTEGERIVVGGFTTIVAEAPDGNVYVVTYTSDGRFYRIDRK